MCGIVGYVGEKAGSADFAGWIIKAGIQRI